MPEVTRSVRRLDDLLLEASPADPPPAWALDDLALLRETQVLDVRVDAARSVAGVLLDSRQALAVPGGNAVVLVVTGLRDLRWRLDGVVARVHALSVSGGEATAEGRGQRLLLRCDPRAELVVLGARVAAHVVLVPGLPEAPVDYTEGDDDAIRAGTPSWDHGAEVLVSWELGGVALDVRPGTSMSAPSAPRPGDLVRADLRRVHSPDVPDLTSWRPDGPDFAVLLQLMVGPAGGPGEESFDVLVCSVDHLGAEVGRERVLWVRHTLVVEDWSWPVLLDRLRRRVTAASGPSWEAVATSLSTWARWEFEGYED